MVICWVGRNFEAEVGENCVGGLDDYTAEKDAGCLEEHGFEVGVVVGYAVVVDWTA